MLTEFAVTRAVSWLRIACVRPQSMTQNMHPGTPRYSMVVSRAHTCPYALAARTYVLTPHVHVW